VFRNSCASNGQPKRSFSFASWREKTHLLRKLGRSIDAVYVKASREGLSLRLVPEQELPVSQS
jgi:hypothetical protein